MFSQKKYWKSNWVCDKNTRMNYDPKNEPEHLHWIHIIVSNAKTFINGTFHGLDSIHLQRYLNEFCYCFNRRWMVSGVKVITQATNLMTQPRNAANTAHNSLGGQNLAAAHTNGIVEEVLLIGILP